MLRHTLLAGVAILSLASAASAADMAIKAPPIVAPVAVAPSWSGFYLGAVVGAGMYNSAFDDSEEEISYVNLTGKALGWNIGATLGYNWQWGQFVYGLEGDWSWTDAHKRVNTYIYPDDDYYVESKMKWFATLRARAGFTTGNFLAYITGGPAWVKADHTAIYYGYPCNYEGEYSTCGTKTQTGLAVGAGIEGFLSPNWSAKLEYLYITMPTHELTYYYNEYAYQFNDDAHIIRAGLNYHFNWGAPVVARY